MKKKFIKIIVALAIVVGIVVIISVRLSNRTQKIILGAEGTDTAVWQYIAKSKQAKEAGLSIQVKDFTDLSNADKALADGSIDANASQSYAFFTNFNKNSKTKLVALGTTYIQPMGIYSQKFKTIKQIPDGATIVVANDAATESRGIKLLAAAGLLTLKKSSVDGLVTPGDIEKNPKNLKISTVEATTAARVVKDDKIAAATIDYTTAQLANLDVFKESLYYEKVSNNTKANINVLATSEKHKNKAQLKKLLKLYHNSTIQKHIKSKYPGKVSVVKPISYLSGDNDN